MKVIAAKRKSLTKKNPTFSQSLLENDHLEMNSPTPRFNTTKNNYNSTQESKERTFQTNPLNSEQSQPPRHPINSLPIGDKEVNPEDYRTFFLPEEGYTWDFCIVVPNPEFYKKKHEDEAEAEEHSSTKSRRKSSVTVLNPNKVSFEDIIERLYLAGLQTYCFHSGDEDEIFIKIRAPLERLKEHATEVGFEVLYDPQYLKNVVDKKTAPIADDQEITLLTPYQFIYGPYDLEKPQLFAHAHNLSHPFSPIIRIKLVMDIITSDEDGCCGLNLRKLFHDGPTEESQSVIAFFPLHDEMARDQLNKIWLNWNVSPWEQPIDEVKEYFGEKVALYFEFIGHYTTWCRTLMIAGIIVAIDMAVETGLYNSIDQALVTGYTIPFFCIFVSFWSQFMIEYWKRREARKAMEWGTSEFEETQAQRPEFHGLPIHSVVDGKLVKYFDSKTRVRKLWYSYFIIGSMMVLVIGCVSGIFGLQYYINSDVNDDNNKNSGNTAVSIFSAVQIVVLNAFYSDLAINLNDNENHRTDTEYDDALIGKLFAFSFINSYASLFFIAFIKSNLGEACQGPCMAELAYQLTILLASKITIEKVTNYVTLKVTHYITYYTELAEYQEAVKENRTVYEPSKIEIEKQLEVYDPSLGVLYDYAQIFVQFGFVTLFVSACPVAPILAYYGNQVEIRGDGSKLLYDMRRTIPTGAQDIGTWLVILQMTAVIAVVTNAGIVCFTMQLITFSAWGSVWLFIGFQYFIFVSMAIFDYAVDDIPEDVKIQLQRQDYLRDRAEMTEEDREQEKNKKIGIKPKHTTMPPYLFKVHEIDEENPTKEAVIPAASFCIIC